MARKQTQPSTLKARLIRLEAALDALTEKLKPVMNECDQKLRREQSGRHTDGSGRTQYIADLENSHLRNLERILEQKIRQIDLFEKSRARVEEKLENVRRELALRSAAGS